MKVAVKLDQKALVKVQRNLKALSGFPGQKRSIRDAAYKALKPIEKAARAQFPLPARGVSDRDAPSYDQLKPTPRQPRNPGTLKKSIGRKKARRAPVALVGPRRGRNQRNDGWYGHFLEGGTKSRQGRGRIRGYRFMEKAKRRSAKQTGTIFIRELDNSFDKYANKALGR